MEGFLNWFFAFMTTMFGAIWNGIKYFFLGIVGIFNFPAYIDEFNRYRNDFGVIGWILSVFCFLLVYGFWFSVIFLIVYTVKKNIHFHKSLSGNEDLLYEISCLHKEIDRLNIEKVKIADMKVNPLELTKSELNELNEDDDLIPAIDKSNGKADTNAENKRFFRLSAVDEKYAFYVPPVYNTTMNLQEICDDLRFFASYNSKIYYDIKTIRLMIAGLATTKLILLQGISGTGKTSLPYIMGKYFKNDATITSVQPSWRDRSELFGFFNDFTKKFNETEVLRRIYESSYNDDINIIVLDEMNIARVEYYFAEMLSILEMPDPAEWKIEVVPSSWPNDPKHLIDGKLSIPQNVFYVGTANNDDSTFAVSDKVYDRALAISLDSKGVPFEAPATEAKEISYSYLSELYNKAIIEHPVSDEILEKIEKLDLYVIDKFRTAFGNRIMKQLKIFAPVYVACGGDMLDAVDYMLVTKVFRKFDGLNFSLIRDEIKGLISFMDNLFGKEKMKESESYLLRLQKSF